MKKGFRFETDSMGKVKVPVDSYYGAQTARALENFPAVGLKFQRRFIRAIGLIKKHAAAANESLGEIAPPVSRAIQQAAQEVIQGKLDGQFVVEIFQTGSGTSTNMNANEVIANRAAEILGLKRGAKEIHPNDHVNRGQSSNDVIPSAMHISALEAIKKELVPSLESLSLELKRKMEEFHGIIKIGRTHLQDAMPVRLGQIFGGFASQIDHGIARLMKLEDHLSELALGGTAVGTGINAHPEFASRTIAGISHETGLNFRKAANHFEAQSSRDAVVEVSGALKVVAVSLIKIANDIRFLGSGPRCGIGEIKLPAVQPGSSIMPGKVNPVIPEMLIQICAQVIGNDAAITLGGAFANFELNTMMPLMAYNIIQSIELLTKGCDIFRVKCIAGIEADAEKCAEGIEKSLAMVTPLAAVVGYDKAAIIAKKAYETGKTIREIAIEEKVLAPATLNELLDPEKLV